MDIYKYEGLSPWESFIKRFFDLLLSTVGLAFTWWIILLAFLLATIDTGRNGFFTQNRIGQHGRIFRVIKIRTMREDSHTTTTVTTSRDSRITTLGRFLRRLKIDELPQLFNVLIGDMSFVGPRPDVPGFADKLKDEDRMILSIKPGITSPATLKFRNEEDLLSNQKDPEYYNATVIYPEKVRLNLEYMKKYSFWKDILCIWQTLFK